MRAHLGDRLVIESPTTWAKRDGEIVGLHHEDGTPPYDVRWSDTDEVTLVFPGPDAHIRHVEHEQPGSTHTSSQPDTGAAKVVSAAAPTRKPNPGDIGRRVAVERHRQKLSLDETARRARMSPHYLAYLEDHPADPTVATLIRLADALGTTVTALRGAGIDFPPGQGQALLHPQLRDLSPEECRDLLSTHGVGRVAVSTPGGPAVVPVNYEVVDGAIAFRTKPDSVPARAVGSEVAFEVDHVDEAMSQGWSVLVVGSARVVTEPDAVRQLADRAHTTPWPGGEREMWVSVEPTRLTGRRIGPADQ
ncbi:pyridoxamine 5'-phosphate oxidase family protein [Streptomyces sp. ME18-1-4]|uniref:pyridoxamine 5'-phosphate oxidase family protein n=1 Tax=Streptomyces sp. ME18-1-4 TaxID=3028685 RepID=UPI0029AF090F|nr:pyridoxamine 5'-phosphate oxidase family protein [Streptomyces sp. ME18-1-4]MDX3242422.1 pyridoxamine 5'-phosphate oxidase family protein [Streptomyces sp. ME18-1-4]